MVTIETSSNQIVTGSRVRVEAFGGLEPYSFSLLPNGDGGFLSQDNYYIAPGYNRIGHQDIRVVDANGENAVKRIFILNHVQAVCSIISGFMELDADQVVVFNEKFTIPRDNRLYISVGISGSKVIGNNNRFHNGTEYQYITMQSQISINIMSKSYEAINRKDEVIMSLNSNISKKMQYLNGFRLAAVPFGINELSGVDGSAIPYRFNVSLNLIYSKKINAEVGFYDDFSKVLIDDSYAPVVSDSILALDNDDLLQLTNGDNVLL